MLDLELSLNFYKMLASDANKEACKWFLQILIKIRQHSILVKLYDIIFHKILSMRSQDVARPQTAKSVGGFLRNSSYRKRKSMFYPQRHCNLCKCRMSEFQIEHISTGFHSVFDNNNKTTETQIKYQNRF